MNPERLLTQSLRELPQGAAITRILAAALTAVDPATAVREHLRRAGEWLHVGGHSFDLARFDRVFLISFGKAGVPMAAAAVAAVGDRLADAVVVVKDGHTEAGAQGVPAAQLQQLTLIEAGHPIPDQRSVAAAQRVAELLAQATERDLVLALISGGGSALLTLPVDGVTLADLQGLTAALLACGATINEINSLRKHLDRVKGGGLARMAHPATLVTLILSDVVGNPLDVIASGPAVADTSTFADAFSVLEHYGVVDRVPAPIVAHLRRGVAGAVPDTPKPGDPQLERVLNVLVGSNAQAAAAAIAAAQAEGFNTLLLTTYFQGEAREAGRFLGAIVRELAASGHPLQRPACVVAGGETTVTIRGDGLGGRNQELALAAVADLAGLEGVALVALATDGGDGPTDAAGAVVTGTTLVRARGLGLDPAAFLAGNDSYHFFSALGDLLQPGPTQTNVNDLVFLFAF